MVESRQKRKSGRGSEEKLLLFFIYSHYAQREISLVYFSSFSFRGEE
jgi:hypothetical protein